MSDKCKTCNGSGTDSTFPPGVCGCCRGTGIQYYDIDGRAVSLFWLVQTEPEWAANRIAAMQSQQNQTELDLRLDIARLRAAAEARDEAANEGAITGDCGYACGGRWTGSPADPTTEYEHGKGCPELAHPLDPATPALAREVAATVALANDPDVAGRVETKDGEVKP